MMIYLLFAATLVLSATLLFLVQPMMTKMLLPLLGGTPAVWNVCLVFFQAMLLAGYAYAHFSSKFLEYRKQAVLHLALVASAAVALPILIPESAVRSVPTQANPSFWLLAVLLMVVGLPFFVVSTTNPMLQQWFSRTAARSAKDPYFLYSASNLGSLAALLGYPLIVEPNLRLEAQSRLWSGCYWILAVLIAVCAAVVWRTASRPTTARDPATPPRQEAAPVSMQRRWRWVAFAFVPSSLMLGVTTYITTDIASIPLLWVIPLALYLLSFILVFAAKPPFPLHVMARLLPVAAVTLTFVVLSNAIDPVWFLLLIHLLFFFITCMVCHGQLAADRPATHELTAFYLWMSFGGVLGGVFNALIAPVLFNGIVEYPLAIVLACLLRPRLGPATDLKRGVVDLGMAVIVMLGLFAIGITAATTLFQLEPGLASNALIFAVPTVVCYTFLHRPIRFASAIGALLLCGSIYIEMHGRTIYAERNFFGLSRVSSDPSRTFHRFIHGDTTHGRQFIDPQRRCEPLAYYHRSGPLGGVMNNFNSSIAIVPPRVAVIGLGTGSMISYATEGQEWTYYEIDPTVIHVAQNPRLFRYLSDCAKVKPRIVAGDARLRLREAPEHHYGLIVLDAFSSDAIPVHLLTRQALELYLAKLAEGGTLAMHISNRYLELAPVVGDLAKSAGLVCVAWDDSIEDKPNGKEPSHWVVLARDTKALPTLLQDPHWVPVRGNSESQVWTDDFSNILSVFKWR